MFKKRIAGCLLLSIVVFLNTSSSSYAESKSAEDLSYHGANILILSPYSFAFPLLKTAYLTSEEGKPVPDTSTLSEEMLEGVLLTPAVAAYGSGMMLAGISCMPIEAIKKHSELKKSDIQNIPAKPGQPTANLQIQQNGQTKNVQIPLEVKAHPIQLNQKIETPILDPEDRISSVVTLEPLTPAEVRHSE